MYHIHKCSWEAADKVPPSSAKHTEGNQDASDE